MVLYRRVSWGGGGEMNLKSNKTSSHGNLGHHTHIIAIFSLISGARPPKHVHHNYMDSYSETYHKPCSSVCSSLPEFKATYEHYN